MKAVTRPRMRLGEYSAAYEKHSGAAAPKASAGDKAPDHQPSDAGRQRRRDRGEAVEGDGKPEHRLAAKAVGQLALTQRADKEPEQGSAADGADPGRRREMRPQHVRHQRAQDDEVDDVEEQSGGDDRQHPLVDRPQPRVVERLVDIGHDRLRHRLPSSPSCRRLAVVFYAREPADLAPHPNPLPAGGERGESAGGEG